ncbi:unnamed protein product, partial [Rotaria magnacalcarata]
LNLKTILDFDDNNDCEVDEEEEDGNKNENDEEAIDILPYCSNSKTLSKSCVSNKKRTPLQSTIRFNERPSTVESTKRIKRNDFEKEIQDAQRYQLASYSREKRWRLCSASVAFTLIT